MSVELYPVLLVLSGPSGAGKTTVAQRLLSGNERLARVVTCTTRIPREGEIDGVDYHFLSNEEFMRRVEAAEFLEHAEVYGNQYGTMKSAVREMLASGRDVLLVNDVQGAMAVSGDAAPREPRVAAGHPGVRVLRRMHAEIRQRECLEVLHGGL